MIYRNQQNLITGLQFKDRNLWDFLSTIDNFLSTLSSISGTVIVTCKQNNFPKLTNGQPQFIYVQDFAHLIFWDGQTTPKFADGGNNFYSLSDIIPSSIGWVQVAGQSIKFLNPNGTLTSKTLIDTTATSAFLKATNTTPASFTAPNAAVISGHVDSGNANIANTNLSPTTNKFTVNAAGSSAVIGFTDPHNHIDTGHIHNVNTVPGTLINDTTGTPESFNSKLWFRL